MVMLETNVDKPGSHNLKFVRFCDVPLTLKFGEDFFVEFEISLKVKCSTRDWIGIFEENWKALESFVAYEWGIGRSCEGGRRKIKFHSKYFCNKVSCHSRYQFVYVSRYLEILGTSSYFVFDNPIMDTIYTFPVTSCDITMHQENNCYNRCKIQNLPHINNLVTTCNLCHHLVGDRSDLNSNETLSIEITELDRRMDSLECIVDAIIARIVNNEENIERKLSQLLNDHQYDDCANNNCEDFKLAQSSLEEAMNNKCMPVFEDQFCFLKAVIGHQEEKIQSLTKMAYQEKAPVAKERPSLNKTEHNTVKLVKAEEKMLAQIMRINENCEEFSSDADGRRVKESKVEKAINWFERSTAL